MSVARRDSDGTQLRGGSADIPSAPIGDEWMSGIVRGIRTLDELQSFVRTKLCDKENLLLEQTKVRHAPLIKQGKLCGYQFSVQGPRQVRLGAVWASDHNDVYFYDTRGNRYDKAHLSEQIALSEQPAA